MKQQTLTGFEKYGKTTRRAQFLADMERIILWPEMTAAASAGIYLRRGYIDPGLSMPVMLGVLAGSLAGTRILVQAETKWLRLVFSVVILLLGAQMIYNGAAGKI